MVESQPSKLLVAGSIPVSRSNLRSLCELRLASRLSLSLGRFVAYGSAEAQRAPGRLVGRSAEGAKADVAQLAERVLGKDEVTSSILVIGSIPRSVGMRRMPTIVRAESERATVGRLVRYTARRMARPVALCAPGAQNVSEVCR